MSLDWRSSPVLRIADYPEVTPIIVQLLNALVRRR
jgi:hypothetical protein